MDLVSKLASRSVYACRSDYDDIRQSLTHENLPSRGLGQALPTSAGNAGIAVSRGPLVP